MPWFTYFSLSLVLKNLVVYSIKNFEVKINLGADRVLGVVCPSPENF